MTTASGHISSTSGTYKQLMVLYHVKLYHCQALASAGTSGKPSPKSASGLDMGMDSNKAGGINKCLTQMKYIYI